MSNGAATTMPATTNTLPDDPRFPSPPAMQASQHTTRNPAIHAAAGPNPADIGPKKGYWG
ncbi:hypothetical protein [Bifidobacterium longum]|uniref:hypothetical protein n=1 Tax=Bifidobacterium longum TaxID=216816 RepID=UPI0030F412BB